MYYALLYSTHVDSAHYGYNIPIRRQSIVWAVVVIDVNSVCIVLKRPCTLRNANRPETRDKW